MRSISLPENVLSRTIIVFLAGILTIASIQIVVEYRKYTGGYRHNRVSSRETSDVVLMASFSSVISTWSTTVEQLESTTSSEQEEDSFMENKLTITQQQRSLDIMYRLSRFKGSGRGSCRLSYLLVSLIGIFGMFSAIIGALIGPWLADTSEDLADEDRFVYWVREEEDEDDGRICGSAREEKYGLYRILDAP